MKVTITNLEALERLLGGDKEFEIELRNSVVQQFAHRHLKAIANSPLFKIDDRYVRDQLIKELVDKHVSGADFKKRVNIAVDAAVKKIEDELTDAIVSKKIDNLVNARIKEKLGL